MNPKIDQANKLYRQARDAEGGMSDKMRLSYFERALQLYGMELEKATPPNRASLLKNIGLTHLRLGEIMDPSSSLQLIMYHLVEGVGSFCSGWLMKSEEERKSLWGAKIEENMFDCFTLAFDAVEEGNTAATGIAKYAILDRFGKTLDIPGLECFKSEYLLAKGHHFLDMGMNALEKSDFKLTNQLLEYAMDEVKRLTVFLGQEELKIETDSVVATKIDLRALEDQVEVLRVSCESLGYRTKGDALFDLHINQSKELNLEIVWDILDLFKSAAISCREKDVENEAIAISRQGRMFEKVLKMKEKAHQYYRRAFDLGLTLGQKKMYNVPWFKECRKAIARFQEEKCKEEEAKKAKEREPYLQKMQSVLTELKKVHDKEDPYKLLAYIYSKHPPKNVQFTYVEKDTTAENLKKVLITAISHYHPDKHMQDEMEVRILVEEITKCLTARYERTKGI